MIKYVLICKDCNKEFESWFGSSKEYDRLKKMKLLNCQNCSSLNVEKSLMAPNLSKTKKSSEQNEFKFKEVKQKLKEYKKFVKDLIISKRIETLYSSEDNEVDIFREIFMKNCRKTKEINDFLLKHDIKKCIK